MTTATTTAAAVAATTAMLTVATTKKTRFALALALGLRDVKNPISFQCCQH